MQGRRIAEAMRQILVIFTTVFLAELGDKTQLATLLFASDERAPSPLWVFCAAAGALGTAAERYLTAIPLKLIAGLGFIVIGIWTVAAHFRGA